MIAQTITRHGVVLLMALATEQFLAAEEAPASPAAPTHSHDVSQPSINEEPKTKSNAHESMSHEMPNPESDAAATTHEGPMSMDMSSMQGGRAPVDARSPDYSDGQGMSTMPGMAASMNDDATIGKLFVEELEWVDESGEDATALDAQAYVGRDQHKLWVKADGEVLNGHLRDLRVEVLWDRAWRAFWDTQLGVRHDAGDGPERTWLAAGVEGLAPYWFDIEATLYVGSSGRTAVRLEAEYDLRLTQRLIFTPDVELNAYGKSDPERQIGSGLSNIEFGFRLRYEFRRQFAPYVGFNWDRRFGETADLVRAAGESAHDSTLVAGLRIWF